MTTRPTKLILLFSILFVAIACQDEKLEENIEPVDQDMIDAIELADRYLNSSNGRTFGNARRSITVLQYVDGVLYFNTNTDDVPGYQVVEETSITAYAEPGEFVFWYSGGGVTNLGEIDFDATAEDFLENLPDEVDDGHMWVIRIPEESDDDDDDDEDEDDDSDEIIQLKYDIVYETATSVGSIRLDPIIKLTGPNQNNAQEDID